MAEEVECKKCIMIDTIDRMQEDIKESIADRKANEKETRMDVSVIKAGQEKATYITEQVQKTQDLQSIAAEKNQIANIAANEKNLGIINAGFKAIEDRRIADEEATVLEKKEADKEKLRLKELQDAKDEAARLEKKADRRVKVAQTWSLYLIGLGIIANLILGVLVKWAPTLIGLPAGK